MPISPVGISPLQKVVQEALDNRLDRLTLADAFIEDDGCSIVAEALCANRSIKSLDLRGCNVGPRGAKILAGAIQSNTVLLHMGLEWNNIGMTEGGIEALCQSLEGNTSLEMIDLRNNAIQEAGGRSIASMLRRNRGIRSLDLRWNNIGPEGGKAIADAVQSNSSLVELFLSGNKINDDSLREIEARLEVNKQGNSAPIYARRAAQSVSSTSAGTRVYETSSTSLREPFNGARDTASASAERRGILQMQGSFRDRRTESPDRARDGWLSSQSPILSTQSPQRPNNLSVSVLSTSDLRVNATSTSRASSPYLPVSAKSMPGAQALKGATWSPFTSPPEQRLSGGAFGTETGLSLEKWDATMKDRIVQLTGEVMNEKEAYIRMEAQYRHEMAARNDLEVAHGKLEAEYNALVRSAQLDRDNRQRLEADIELMARDRADLEQHCHRLAEDLASLQNETALEARQMERRVEELESVVKSLKGEVGDAKGYHEEEKGVWREREARLLEELRVADEQKQFAEERFLKVQGQEREVLEAHVRSVRSEFELRIAQMDEEYKECERGRRRIEEEMTSMGSEYETRMKELDKSWEGRVRLAEEEAERRIRAEMEELKRECASKIFSELSKVQGQCDRRVAAEEQRAREAEEKLERTSRELTLLEQRFVRLEDQMRKAQAAAASELKSARDEAHERVSRLEARVRELEVAIREKEQEMLRLKEGNARGMAELEGNIVSAVTATLKEQFKQQSRN